MALAAMVYLDANATEPLRPEARAAMLSAFDGVGNPSSIHRFGRSVRRVVEDARESLAARFGGRPGDLVFVSGGTEADALAVHALGRDRRLIIGATEHDAIRSAASGASVLPVDRDGIADLDALRVMLGAGGPALVCLMLANNETGTIQPIRDAAMLCREYGALLHVDAVQAAGRLGGDLDTYLPLPLREGAGGRGRHPQDRAPTTPPPAPPSRGGESVGLAMPPPIQPPAPGMDMPLPIQPLTPRLALPPPINSLAPGRTAPPPSGAAHPGPPPPTVSLNTLLCHSLALSSHKIGGPPGVGALLLTPELSAIPALITGGGQERGRRGGTLAAPLIAGFAAAAAASCGNAAALAPLRDTAEQAAIAAGAIVCGGGAPRLPNTTCLALPGVRADAQVIALDLEGIAISAGAACSSGKVAASHVLTAMGMRDLAAQAIRVSLPWNATAADIEAFIAAYQRMADRLRPTMAPRAA